MSVPFPLWAGGGEPPFERLRAPFLVWINGCRGLLCLSLRFATQSVGPRLAKSLFCFSSSPLQDFTRV
jgi:hypothetical protein